MSQLTRPVRQLAEALTQRGIPCCTEFPQTPLAVHSENLFAVAAPDTIRLGSPIPLGSTAAVPAVFSLQVRFYLPPHQDTASLHTVVSEVLLPAVFSLGWQIQELSAKAICYEKRLDRFCLPVTLTANGMVTLSAAEEVSDDAI